ncbi:MAG TPA: hypothetical protein VIK33_16405, partial [Anaerolineae bacterium]
KIASYISRINVRRHRHDEQGETADPFVRKIVCPLSNGPVARSAEQNRKPVFGISTCRRRP